MLSNINKLITPKSLLEIYKMNYLLSGVTFVFSFLFLTLEHFKMPYIAFKSGVYIFLTSFAQAFILKYCSARYENNAFKFWRYTLSFAIGIILYFLLWEIMVLLSGNSWGLNELSRVLMYLMFSVVINTIILALHDFVIVRRGKIQADLENYRLQMKNTEAENLVLKEQIQPHFLFNALSTLKILYKKDPEMGEHYLLQLSDFLRVAVSHNNKFIATLEDELSICINYLEMQKIRFTASLDWQIIIEDQESLQGKIPSFSLQPLLENAIKHNVLTAQFPLHIKIHQSGNGIEVFNNINPKFYKETSLKSGLSNLAERYRLLTEEDIIVKNNGKEFSVRFKFLDQ